MTTQTIAGLEIDPSRIGALDIDGRELPYVDLMADPFVHTRLVVGGAVYVYQRSFPVRGGSAIMPEFVATLVAKGKRLVVAERNERYIVYAA